MARDGTLATMREYPDRVALTLLSEAVGTIAYGLNADYIGKHYPDRESATHFYASVDLMVNSLVIALQGLGIARFVLSRFGTGKQSWLLAVTHLSLGPRSRHMQLAFLAELLADEPRVVLMGDFNCDPEAAEMRMLYKRTKLSAPSLCVPTFPSWAPERSLDHILTAGFKISQYRALPAAGSDHLAVAVELQLPAGRKPIVTVHRFDSNRLKVFGFLRDQIRLGRQVYIVYPLIEGARTVTGELLLLDADNRVHRGIHLSINGVAAGLRNTG